MKPQKSDALYVVIIVLAFLLGLAAHLPIPVPASTISGQTEQRNSPDKDRNFQGDGHAITANPQSGTNQADQGGYESSTNWWIAVFTGALVLVAVLQWLTSRSQANSMESGLALAREQNITARISADAARKSADRATDALHAQRAYIVFRGIDVISRHGPGDIATHITLSIKWENGGHTTAIKGISMIQVQPYFGPLPPDWDFRINVNMNNPPPIITIPAQGLSTPNITVPADILIDIFNHGSTRYFFYGWIAYRDIFTDTPIRLTEFCCECVHVSQDGPMPGIDVRHRDNKVRLQFNAWNQFNNTDENCADYESKIAEYSRLLAL